MALRPLAAAVLSKRPLAGLMVGLALAPGAARAQFMALTPPAKAEPLPKADPLPKAAPDARRPHPAPAQVAERPVAGTLPNQRTGPSRERVVRDICIGCDR